MIPKQYFNIILQQSVLLSITYFKIHKLLSIYFLGSTQTPNKVFNRVY